MSQANAAAPVRPPAASIHGIELSADGTHLVVTGTCRRAAAETDRPAGDLVRLHLADASGRRRLGVDTVPAPRFEHGGRRWTGFTAALPVADLPMGSSFPVLEVVPVEGAAVETPALASPGLLASSRPLSSGGRRVQAVPAPGSDRVELVCRRSAAAWSARMARRDLSDLVRRRPFAWARLVRFLTRPLVPGGPVWLIGERADTARDNGLHLFAHVCRERPDVRAHYVIDRASDQRARVAALGRVVAHSSWRHRLLMLHADVIANAYSIKHMLPRQWDSTAYARQLAWRIGAHRVYLKHGINLNMAELRRRVGGYDLYLTATPAETAAARETSGYDRQVVETGLPRYDALVPTPRSRTILFMPTWRLYLAPKLFSGRTTGSVPFEGSDYQRFVVGLVTSPRLLALLDEHDHRFQLLPHYNLREHLAETPVVGDRVDVLDGGTADVQDLLRTCDLFVTDHSSVQFDVAYLGTPVVYAQFDEDDYARHSGPSWFDTERDGFGPVAHDVETTIDAIEHYLRHDCRREAEYDARAEGLFTHRDRDNSRRTVEAIEALTSRTGPAGQRLPNSPDVAS
ncbi:CDP-glycerol glycerophosphotransferase family protein [Aeromicrobium sp. NPDC092404]|uniref:CDP-glycerol glycerophosphotransferase family protein n=1 Tax=Aeromicrobium sp. NPDC092404 TaxID=3154976 RepID=UPI003439ADCA